MATKPTAPPGKELTATEISKLFVQENKDLLNSMAAGESENTGTEKMLDSEDINPNANKTETTMEEDNTATQKTSSPVPAVKVTIPPRKIAFTADGRVLSLPIPNPLRKFASYNYRIGLYALSNGLRQWS